jgi:mRNA interferase MazF
VTFSQGDIIKFNFDPTLGHEQAGYRPAVVISRKMFNEKTGQVIVCPITGRSRPYPTRVPVSDDAETHGFIICDHVKTIDVNARNPVFIERLDERVLDKVLSIVHSEIEKD